ncbi:MAG: hypothetical protein R3A10_01265 [Caldilineaceae bacterium]
MTLKARPTDMSVGLAFSVLPRAFEGRNGNEYLVLGRVQRLCARLAIDLGVFHRKAHAVSTKEAAIWTVV